MRELLNTFNKEGRGYYFYYSLFEKKSQNISNIEKLRKNLNFFIFKNYLNLINY